MREYLLPYDSLDKMLEFWMQFQRQADHLAKIKPDAVMEAEIIIGEHEYFIKLQIAKVQL